MGSDGALERGRLAGARGAWADAYSALSAAERSRPLASPDLERLAIAAYLTAPVETAASALERLHHRLRDEGELTGAVRWAVWLGILLLQNGQHARGGGWLARAERLADRAGAHQVERGYLQVPAGLQALAAGETADALTTFEQVAAIAERAGDTDLTVMGLLGRGQALLADGKVSRGVAQLDEVMVTVTTAPTSPMMAGMAYCAMILACRDVFDLRRAQEWTAALDRWCDAQQGLRPYRGQCLVHRSEILQLHGRWQEAMAEVDRACRHLAEPDGDPVLGMARYQLAELLRLEGRYARAEEAYQQASRSGHAPQPGLALLRLAQGRLADASAAIRREAAEAAGDRLHRARILGASVEILLATDDLDGAADGVRELEETAAAFASTYLSALAAEGRGAVALAERRGTDACVALRDALHGWQQLAAPYETARTRVRLARAYHLLGDNDTADLELDAAVRVFEALGARPALAEARRLVRTTGATAPGGLTRREIEVLRLVATGATNRQVAEALVISEKTVARHLNNLFTKLGLTTRAAATAWAYEHDLA